MSHTFRYIQSDIPEGMSIAEYKASRPKSVTGYRKFKATVRRFIRRG